MLQFHSAVTVCLLILSISLQVGHAAEQSPPVPLTLEAAEQLALERHPQLAMSSANIEIARAQELASGQLPDPELRLGFDNVPVDTLELDRERMSMVTIGLAQRFPPPGTLHARQQGAAQQVAATTAAQHDLIAAIRLAVRRAWLDTFYLDRALTINAENRQFIELVVAAELARLRSGTGEQLSVLQSRLTRDELLDTAQSLAAERSMAASRLVRLLNIDDPMPMLPGDLPEMVAPPSLEELLASLSAHPQIETLVAHWRSAGYQTEVARRAYLPEFGVMAGYGFRQAEEVDGGTVPDMISIGLTMSLPLFPGKRQDARLQARAAQELVARYARDDRLLEMRADVQARYAEYERLGERLRLLKESQLPTAGQAVDTALAAYRSNQAPLSQVIEKLHQRHAFNLRRWKLATERARAVAELSYLATTMEMQVSEEIRP